MVTFRNIDYLTTILLALIPVILYLKDTIILYVPPAYLILAVLIFAVLSQLAAEQRVKDAVEEVQRWKIFDWLSTILLAFGPILLAYESLIEQQLPPAIVPIAVGVFGLISQYITNKRVQASTPIPKRSHL